MMNKIVNTLTNPRIFYKGTYLTSLFLMVSVTVNKVMKTAV